MYVAGQKIELQKRVQLVIKKKKKLQIIRHKLNRKRIIYYTVTLSNNWVAC